MYASMDGYTQLRAGLSHHELNVLANGGTVEGLLHRTDRNLLIIFRISKKGWRAKGIGDSWETKERYEIDMPPGSVQSMREGKIIGTDMTVVELRTV